MASRGQAQKVVYRSNQVELPAGYLTSDPPDARPITQSQIDFANTVLPEYRACYAVVLDNVLSPSECAELIRLAESSSVVGDGEDKDKASAWRPALVNIGAGYEAAYPDYRRSGRIIWDSQEVADRLWARLATVPEVRDRLATVGGGNGDGGWEFYRVNKRLRFLRYSPGEFFRPHCDGAYVGVTDDGGRRDPAETFYTVHLYLNDSRQEVGEAAAAAGADSDLLLGGATAFHAPDGNGDGRRLDVDPRAGRVLVFQHDGLLHSGDDVREGTKYTVRSDIMYRPRRRDRGDGGTGTGA
ncbi:hypothetical protein GGR56DRAFT_652027 [Xylariaceae sp. FL0804]|nr:hypothetical protein GGR56DRAFT_652027 [Xylariaceae sp. FL0804]